MNAVLDASAAIDIVAERGAGAQFSAALESADLVIAPDLIVAEIVNAIWKYHRFAGLSLAASEAQIDLAIELVDRFVPLSELHQTAFLMARTSKRPVYDMFYLALARRDDAVLLTSDSTLKKEAERNGIQAI